MPNFLDKYHKQFTTEQASYSLMCDKILWVLEATSSLLKQNFKALDATFQNKSLPRYLIDFRVSGAFIKKYCDLLRSELSLLNVGLY